VDAGLTEQAEQHHAAIMQTGRPIELEEIQTLPDGSRVHFHIVKSPVLNSEGKVIGSQGLLFDITTRKQTEAALVESQALYHSLVEQLPVGVFRKDAEGRYVFVNSYFCRLKKISREQYLGKFPRELPDDALLTAEGEQHHAEIMQTGEAIELEETKGLNGQTHYFRVIKSPVLNSEGKVIGSLGLLFDITAIKRAELERQKLEARYRMVVENTSDIVTIIDKEGVIHFESQAIKPQLGYDPEALTGRKVFEFLHPDDIPRATQALQHTLEKPGVALSVECRFRHLNGTWRTLQAVGKTIPGSADNADVIISSRDITEQRKLEEQLRQSQKMEAIGQLAGGVAHDFNNILAVIQMQLDLMKISGGLLPDQHESAEEIGKAAQRAVALTRQLLLFSRREALQATNIDLNESITDTTKMLQRIVGEDIQVNLKLAPRPLFIRADARMIDQVLVNLAVNSRDAMAKGGKLIIETDAIDFDAMAATQSLRARPGSFVRLSVGDTGQGIRPEILPRIFEPFFTTKDVGKGTGLGLATVLGIVQQHHGWIDVYSETGRGTTFRIYFPRLQKPAVQDNGPAAPILTHGGQETILLVEDDRALRASIRNALAHLGYHVLVADNGINALEVWKQNRQTIDLLFTDLVMPDGMNGFELAQQILKETPGLRVIYASGYCADVASGKIPLKEGFNFLPKPFDTPRLAQTVRNRLDGKG
jgi:PAS domain S-box-containing protein